MLKEISIMRLVLIVLVVVFHSFIIYGGGGFHLRASRKSLPMDTSQDGRIASCWSRLRLFQDTYTFTPVRTKALVLSKTLY